MLVIFTGCTTVYTKGPMAIVDSPEVISSNVPHLNLDLGLLPVDNIEFVKNASSRPLTPTIPPVLGQQASLLGGLSLNTRIPLELGLALNSDFLMTGSFGTLFSAKYQLLGPTNEKMQTHCYLLSVSTHLSYSSQNLAGQQNGQFGPGGYPWSANSHFGSYDLGVSYGYRQDARWLYYMGYSYQTFNADTTVNQSPSDIGASPAYGAAIYAIPITQGINSRAALGVVISPVTPNKVETKFDMQVAYITSAWNQQSLNEWSFALSMIVPLMPREKTEFVEKVAPTVKPEFVEKIEPTAKPD